jgi:hypothetical protein
MGTRTDYAYGQSNYLRAADLAGRQVRVVITHVDDVEFDRGVKPVLGFANSKKGLVVNSTNYDTIANAFGDNTQRWNGHAIILKGEKVRFKGGMVDSIRVAIPPQAAPKAPPSNAEDVPFNDEIPDFAA